MNIASLIFRLIVAPALTLAMLVIVWLLAGEVTAEMYTHHHGIAARVDLSEDYGFGMLAMLIGCVAALLALPLAALAGWRLSGRFWKALIV